MIDPDIIQSKIEEDESPILEFKREWYWDNLTPSTNLGDKWGEFVKDLVSLANGYLDYVGKDRYLIIGYDEVESKIFNVDSNNIKILEDLRAFKKILTQKLEKITNPTILTFNVEFVVISDLRRGTNSYNITQH